MAAFPSVSLRKSYAEYQAIEGAAYKESEELMQKFDELMEKDVSFRENVREKEARRPTGTVISDPRLGREIWIISSPKSRRFVLYPEIRIGRGTFCFWSWAVDPAAKKVKALGTRFVQVDEGSVQRALFDFQNTLFSKLSLGPRPISFFSRLYQASDGPKTQALTLQSKYHWNLLDFATEYRMKPERARIISYVCLEFIRQVGLLHHAKIAHRDIKPENVLVKEKKNGGIKVALTDFEFARGLGQNVHLSGTPQALSPQLAERLSQNNRMADVSELDDAWALGIALLGFLHHSGELSFIPPFALAACEYRKTILDILALSPDWIAKSEPEDPLERVLWGLLRIDPKERWTALKAFQVYSSRESASK